MVLNTEARVRKEDKEGGTHRPQTIAEIGLLIHADLQKLTQVSRGMLDFMRHKVSFVFLRSHVG